MLSPEIQKTLNRLSAAVAEHAVTQEAISEATGVHQSQVSRILSGQVRRESKNIRLLCKYYDLHISKAVQGKSLDVPLDIQRSLVRLLSGQNESDIALRALLESLAKWRDSSTSAPD